MNNCDDIMIRVAEIVGDAGEVKSINEPARGTYTISVAFLYPWTDPIGIEDYYMKIVHLIGFDGHGRVRLMVEPSNSEPNKVYAKITVFLRIARK